MFRVLADCRDLDICRGCGNEKLRCGGTNAKGMREKEGKVSEEAGLSQLKADVNICESRNIM